MSKSFIAVITQMTKLSKAQKFGKIDHALGINCADQVLKLLLTYNISTPITVMFANLLQNNVDELVNDLLAYNQIGSHKMKSFFEQTDRLISKTKSREENIKALNNDITIANSKKTAMQHLTLIVEEFNKKWSEQLLLIHTNISNMFPNNQETSSEVMKSAAAAWMKLFFKLICF